MELALKGFDDWTIDTAHTEEGDIWAEVWRKNKKDWYQFSSHKSLEEALTTLIEDGLQMTEDEICQMQESCY